MKLITMRALLTMCLKPLLLCMLYIICLCIPYVVCFSRLVLYRLMTCAGSLGRRASRPRGSSGGSPPSCPSPEHCTRDPDPEIGRNTQKLPGTMFFSHTLLDFVKKKRSLGLGLFHGAHHPPLVERDDVGDVALEELAAEEVRGGRGRSSPRGHRYRSL